jgi:glycosyltransferase involved in cell wall biosynthesis
MKILHINTWDTGGAGNAAKRLFRAQKTSGLEVDFLSLKKEAKDREDLNSFEDFLVERKGKVKAKSLHLANKVYNQLPIKFDKKLFFNRPETLYQLEEHPLVQAADIIHFHSVVKFVDIPSFFQRVSKPVVWTLHDMNPFRGGMHYDSMMLDKLSALEERFVQVKQKAMAGSNIHVVALSGWLEGLSRKSVLFSKFPHYIIPNCISTDNFHPIQSESNKTTKKILFVAQNVNDPRKGFQYLLDALPYLNKEIELMILGNVTNKEMFGNNDKVTYLGYVSDPKELSKIYSEATIHVISSIEDNLPNTIVESHLCGTPVVGFNCTGIGMMIKDSFNGVLVNELEGKALAKGIHRALDLIDSGEIRSEKIVATSQAYYSEERVVAEYKKVYELALEHK